MPGYIDLHIHTDASDGVCSFEEIVSEAKNKGLKAIAITDHGTINDRIESRLEIINGLEVVSGVEINTDYNGSKIEILGYFIDPKKSELLDLLDKIKERRRTRIREMVKRLNEELEKDIDVNKIADTSDSSVGRPHIARELLRLNVVSNIEEAFDEYIGEKCSSYVPLQRVHWKCVIDIIHDSGGLAVLAHPLLFDFEDIFKEIETMSEYGLDGVEVFYPYDILNKKLKFKSNDFISRIKNMNLIMTGGSDYHGNYGSELGYPEVEYKYLEFMQQNIKDNMREG